MGRVTTSIEIKNAFNESFSLQCTALVDSGSAHLTLPSIWKTKLGDLKHFRYVTVELGDHSHKTGELCGPVIIKIKGFPEFYGQVLFIDMNGNNHGEHEPLLGYIPLELSEATLDMAKDRLIPVKYVDLK